MSATKQLVHVRSLYKRQRNTTTVFTAPYCHAMFTRHTCVNIDTFLAIDKIEPEVLCPRCMDKTIQNNYYLAPEMYKREQALILLATTEL